MKPYERDYCVLQKIGEGGMGEVHLAKHLRLGYQVALKLLLRRFLNDDNLVDRFRREARLLVALDHPNIVHLMDAQLDVEDPYIAFEYVADAVSLQSGILDPGRTPLRSAAIVLGLFEGLAYLHRAGILHRDVKPANVLLDATGTVRIIDFGLGRKMNADETRLTMEGQILGTFAYMAPEQMLGDALDFRTDLYSATLVAVEVFAKRLIFGGTEGPRIPPATRMAWGVNSLQELCPDLPRSLMPHVSRLLQPLPEDRPKDASTFIEALARLIAGGAGPDTAPVRPEALPDAPRPRRSKKTTQIITTPVSKVVPPTRYPRPLMALGILLAACLALVVAIMPARRPAATAGPLPPVNLSELDWRWTDDQLTLAFRTDRPCMARLDRGELQPPRSEHRITSPPDSGTEEAEPRLLVDDRPFELPTEAWNSLATWMTSELRARAAGEILRAAEHSQARNRARGAPDAPIDVFPPALVKRMASVAPWARLLLGGAAPFDAARQGLWNQIQESLAIEEWCRGQRIEAPLVVSRLLPREYRASLHFVSNDEYRLLNPLKLSDVKEKRAVSVWNSAFTEQWERGPESWMLTVGGAVLVGHRKTAVFEDVADARRRAGAGALRSAIPVQIPAAPSGNWPHIWLGYQPCAEKGTTGLMVSLPSGLKRRLPLAGPQALRYVKLPPWSLPSGSSSLGFEVVPSPGLPDHEGCWFKGLRLILTRVPLPADVIPTFR